MQLDDVLEGDQALLYMERYVDEGTRTYSRFAAKSKVEPEFQPRSSRPSFELVTVFAPPTQVSMFQADPQSELLEFYVQPDEVRFLIHPETMSQFLSLTQRRQNGGNSPCCRKNRNQPNKTLKVSIQLFKPRSISSASA